MKKEIIVCIIIVIAIIVGNIVTQNYTVKSIGILSEELEELKKDGLSYEKIEEICKCSNKKPKISIRTNKIKIDRESLKQKLKQEGIQVEEGILEDFLILSKAKGIEKIDEFRNGLFTVQDEAAGLVAIILNPNQGDNILDACSSPGGKTSYIAELIEDKGKIEAWDIHKHRTELVEKTAERLGGELKCCIY